MTRSSIDLPRAVRLWRWRSFVHDLGAAWRLIAVGLVLLALFIAVNLPPTPLTPETGTLVGAHQIQSDTGRGTTRANVRLDRGAMVTVILPQGAPILVGARVVVQRSQRQWPPESVIYRFGEYEQYPSVN